MAQLRAADWKQWMFPGASIVLLLVLYTKMRRGVDLTDEMQHYGELVGLLEAGQLFTTDLFIQQTVWILFYPFLAAYHSLFGDTALILTSRGLLALLIIAVYVFGVRVLASQGVDKGVAAIAMLSTSFAITHGNIFSIHYNVINQVIILVFTLRFITWNESRPESVASCLAWSSFPFLAAFAHPLSAILMSGLILGRILLERRWTLLGRMFCCLTVAAIAGLGVALLFSPFPRYIDAALFSKGYGVGAAFLNSQRDITSAVYIGLMFAVALFVPLRRWRWYIALVFLLSLVLTLSAFLFGRVTSGISHKTLFWMAVLCASAIAYLRCTALNRSMYRSIVVVLLSFSLLFMVTSGNGARAMIGAFMLMMPLTVAFCTREILLDEDASTLGSKVGAYCAIAGIAVSMTVYWSRYPYRSAPWYQSSQDLGKLSPVFYGIKAGSDAYGFLEKAKEEFGNLKGKPVLITGHVPALYFILNVKPETCMFFMHSVKFGESQEILENCLRRKDPDYLLLIKNKYKNRDVLAVPAMVQKLFKVDGDGCDRSVPFRRFDFSGIYRVRKDTTMYLCRIGV